jgi:hypothetical protein
LINKAFGHWRRNRAIAEKQPFCASSNMQSVSTRNQKGEKNMKRKIILSIALTTSIILVSLAVSDRTVSAEPPQRYAWDTGIIPRGPNQILRVTVTAALDLNDLYVFRANKQSYTQEACEGGICRLAVAAQTLSEPIAMTAGEAASIDITPPSNYPAVRAVIVSNRPNLRVNAAIIDALTGEVNTQIIIANTEGDIH